MNEKSSKSKYTILVVEDEVPLSRIIKKKLDMSGFHTVTARTVDQALDYLKEISDIDVIWLDHYLLGKEDGLDFVATVKNEKSDWNTIPIFVVSNTASYDKIQSYMRFGIHNYYTKSDYRLDQIVQDIVDYLEENQDDI